MSQSTYIIIGIVVVVCCCLSSASLIVGLYLNSQKTVVEQKNKPGMIGGPCLSDGTCSETNSTCKFNECYEQCFARNAFPCCTEGDIGRIKTYWCDYSSCKPEGSPNDCVDVVKTKAPSAFDLASQSLADTEAKKTALKEQQSADQQAKADAAAKLAADQAQTQAKMCQCLMTGSRQGCALGLYQSDGSDAIPWCYVQGGTLCDAAKPSSYDKGLGWRLCPNSDINGVPK